MTVDLSPIVAPLALLLLTAATSALGVATRALLARFHVADAADLAAQVDIIANAAAGEAYRQAVLRGQDLTLPAGQNAAIAIGASYLLSRAPDVLKQLGMTPDAVAGMVAARVGRLLAADPTVSTGVPVLVVARPVPVDAAAADSAAYLGAR
jgi:hypothetical protein